MKHLLLSTVAMLFAFSLFATDKPVKKALHSDKDVFTNLYFIATNGAKWPIYLEPNGNRYALRFSDNNSKVYRYDIPVSTIKH